jgi:hypothetical protein
MTETPDYQATLDDAAPAGRAAVCPCCGGPLDGNDKFCGHCGAEQPDATETPEPSVSKKHFRCENCGAKIAVDPDERSYVCPFCDSNYVVEFTREESDRQPPEFVIPFAVTREEALEKYRAWISQNTWFRPRDLGQTRIAEKLRGVYLPFWSFSMLAQSNWSARIGEYWYRTETYTTTQNGKTVTKTRRVRETEWWDLGGRHHHYCSQYLVSASGGLAQQEAERIKPFHLPALKRYAPGYLAGWTTEEYSVAADEALQESQKEFLRRERENVAAFLPGDTHGDLDVDTRFSHANSDLILLPIYLLSYRYREKLYRFIINGQTGKTVGDKPVSWPKIALAAAGVVAVAAVVGLLFVLAQ